MSNPDGTPPFPEDPRDEADRIEEMQADFRQAMRLLHVWSAWSGTPGNVEHPAREDVLYPKHPKTCANDGSGREGKMREAIGKLLKKYPYRSAHPTGGSGG